MFIVFDKETAVKIVSLTIAPLMPKDTGQRRSFSDEVHRSLILARG